MRLLFSSSFSGAGADSCAGGATGVGAAAAIGWAVIFPTGICC